MTTVFVKPSKNKEEFSEIKIGTFFISTSDLLYLKTDDKEVYSFETDCVIYHANFNEITVVEPEIILKNKEHRKSSNHTSGDSAFVLHDYTSITSREYISKDESIILGDFYKFNGDELCLRISDNEYFSFKRRKKCVFVKENIISNCLPTNATININCSE